MNISSCTLVPALLLLAGSLARARWDAMGAASASACEGHSDEIYAAQMIRARQ
jgi:hypothetical protein